MLLVRKKIVNVGHLRLLNRARIGQFSDEKKTEPAPGSSGGQAAPKPSQSTQEKPNNSGGTQSETPASRIPESSASSQQGQSANVSQDLRRTLWKTQKQPPVNLQTPGTTPQPTQSVFKSMPAPQREPILNRRLETPKWMEAPQRPYRPSRPEQQDRSGQQDRQDRQDRQATQFRPDRQDRFERRDRQNFYERPEPRAPLSRPSDQSSAPSENKEFEANSFQKRKELYNSQNRPGNRETQDSRGRGDQRGRPDYRERDDRSQYQNSRVPTAQDQGQPKSDMERLQEVLLKNYEDEGLVHTDEGVFRNFRVLETTEKVLTDAPQFLIDTRRSQEIQLRKKLTENPQPIKNLWVKATEEIVEGCGSMGQEWVKGMKEFLEEEDDGVPLIGFAKKYSNPLEKLLDQIDEHPEEPNSITYAKVARYAEFGKALREIQDRKLKPEERPEWFSAYQLTPKAKELLAKTQELYKSLQKLTESKPAQEKNDPWVKVSDSPKENPVKETQTQNTAAQAQAEAPATPKPMPFQDVLKKVEETPNWLSDPQLIESLFGSIGTIDPQTEHLIPKLKQLLAQTTANSSANDGLNPLKSIGILNSALELQKANRGLFGVNLDAIDLSSLESLAIAPTTSIFSAMSRIASVLVQPSDPAQVLKFLKFVERNVYLFDKKFENRVGGDKSEFKRLFRSIIENLGKFAKESPELHRQILAQLADLKKAVEKRSRTSVFWWFTGPVNWIFIALRIPTEPGTSEVVISDATVHTVRSALHSSKDTLNNHLVNQLFFLTQHEGKKEYYEALWEEVQSEETVKLDVSQFVHFTQNSMNFAKKTKKNSFSEPDQQRKASLVMAADQLEVSCKELMGELSQYSSSRKSEIKVAYSALESLRPIWGSLGRLPTFKRVKESTSLPTTGNGPEPFLGFVDVYLSCLDREIDQFSLYKSLKNVANLNYATLVHSSIRFTYLRLLMKLGLDKNALGEVLHKHQLISHELGEYHAAQFRFAKDVLVNQKPESLNEFLKEKFLFPVVKDVAIHRLTGLLSVIADGRPNPEHLEYILAGLDRMTFNETLEMLRPIQGSIDEAQTMAYVTGPYYLEQFVPLDEDEKLYNAYQEKCKKALETHTIFDENEFFANQAYSTRQLDSQFEATKHLLKAIEILPHAFKDIQALPDNEGKRIVWQILKLTQLEEPSRNRAKSKSNQDEEQEFDDIDPPVEIPNHEYKHVRTQTGMSKFVEPNAHFSKEQRKRFEELIKPHYHLLDQTALLKMEAVNEELEDADVERRQKVDEITNRYLNRRQLNFRLDLNSSEFLTDPSHRRQFYQSYHYLEGHKRIIFDQILAARYTKRSKMAEDWILFLHDMDFRGPKPMMGVYLDLANFTPESPEVLAYLSQHSSKKLPDSNSQASVFAKFLQPDKTDVNFFEGSRFYLHHKK